MKTEDTFLSATSVSGAKMHVTDKPQSTVKGRYRNIHTGEVVMVVVVTSDRVAFRGLDSEGRFNNKQDSMITQLFHMAYKFQD